MGQYSPAIVEEISGLLEIGISLSGEQDRDKLLEEILAKALKVTNADAGTLFLREENKLLFEIMHNKTLGTFKKAEEISLPDVKIESKNAAGYVVLEKEILNIADVYNTNNFDFSGPKKYDALTGYRTRSILVVPMENQQGKVIGVLQLINAQNETGEIIEFPTYLEKVVSFLASQAAISLSHLWAVNEIENLLDSYVQVVATAIDARMPYNSSHTQQLVNMLKEMIKAVNNCERGKLAVVEFDHQRKEQLITAAWLHDIGKIAIPLSIMNKSTRLGEKGLELILQRLDYILEHTKVSYLQQKLEKQGQEKKTNYKQKMAFIKETKKLIIRANNPNTYVDDKLKNQLIKISQLNYLDQENNHQPWLKAKELKALTTARGTLTKSERKQIESHVKIGDRILSEVPFPDKFSQVKEWVAMHHELLDGSGYPQGLKGDEIPLETRILTILDIFEAIISPERPYKEGKSIITAVEILDDMVQEGKLDQELVALFKREKIWQAIQY